MPRKKKPAKSLAQLYDEAKADLVDAQKRVQHYQERLEPLRQQLIAELAAMGGPQDGPAEIFDLEVEATPEPQNGLAVHRR